MERVLQFGRETFASLKIRNYRLYFVGQGISLCGNWMQTIGFGWLVLVMTGSGTQLGTILALHYAPTLLVSPFTGVLIDRLDKRTILFFTQSMLGLCALVVSALVYFDSAQIWMLYVFALITGFLNAIDLPGRHTFVHELVGPENLRNAVTLNSTEANLARAIGPLIAGGLIAGVGIAFCFFINALTFLAVLFILYLMRTGEFHKENVEHDESDTWRTAFQYAASIPVIRTVLIVMAVTGTFAYEFQVSLPLLAEQTFLGNASTYAVLMSAMGVGSVVGGLFAASRKNVNLREFLIFVALFGVSICITAAVPTLMLAVVGMFFVGIFSINLSSIGNTMIQLASAPNMRGRVLSLWSMANFGSTLVGAPVIGVVAQYGGARWALALGGVAATAAALFFSKKAREITSFFVPAFIRVRTEEAVVDESKMR